MVRSSPWLRDWLRPWSLKYRIFELIETNNSVQLKSMSDFGPRRPTQKLMWFPQSITQLINEKLVLFPKFCTEFNRFRSGWIAPNQSDFEEEFEFSIDVEEFGKNLYSNRSSSYFPFNLTYEMEGLWIFQV